MAEQAQQPALTVLGIDHRRADVAVRERLSLDDEQRRHVARAISALPGCQGAVVLATCNRLECYIAGSVIAGESGSDRAILDVLATHRGVSVTALEGWVRWRSGEPAVRHAFRVASGLESMVVGEAQIQGQVREAYESARQAAELPSVLHQVFQRALACGKAVRTQTALGRRHVSTASVAIDVARQVVGDLREARILVVGAGEVADDCLAVLATHGATRISVVNRSPERAAALARVHCANVHAWESLDQLLIDHDVVLCSTASPTPVITRAQVLAAMRQRRRQHHRALVLIDLALPRDVEPSVAELDDVYVYHLDHLAAVATANQGLTAQDIAHAEAVIADELTRALAALGDAPALPAAVAAWFAEVEQEELRRHGDTPSEAVRLAVHRVVGRLRHRALERLRQPGGEAVIRDLLGL